MGDIQTPECDKLHAIADKSQVVGEFIEWVREKHGVHMPKSIDDLLADFFEIDQNKVEQEKRAILESLRKRQTDNWQK